MKAKNNHPQLLHLGSLITYQDAADERCLGHLMTFPGHGVFDATFGAVAVSPQEAETHNKLLSEGEIKGLANCQIGQRGRFYLSRGLAGWEVKTFIGTLVSTKVSVVKNRISFSAQGMKFAGIKSRDCEYFEFGRVS